MFFVRDLLTMLRSRMIPPPCHKRTVGQWRGGLDSFHTHPAGRYRAQQYAQSLVGAVGGVGR